MDGFRPRFFERLTDDIDEKGDMADDKGLRCEFRKESFCERSRGGKRRRRRLYTVRLIVHKDVRESFLTCI